MITVCFSKEYMSVYAEHCKYESFGELMKKQSEYYDDIYYIECIGQDLGILPSLPKSLEVLMCNDNKLKKLPKLPDNLRKLFCINNKILELPELPRKLKELWCTNNNIENLPKLPRTLEKLVCNHNKISDLPRKLPKTLQTLFINYTKISSLPLSIIDTKVCLINISSLRFDNTPLYTYIKLRYEGDIDQYLDEKEAVLKIGEWFLKIRYNPTYLYCQRRLQSEFDDLYGD